MQPLRPLSLRWLVPAVSAAVLTLVVALFGAMAYQTVKRSTLQGASERLALAVHALVQPTAQTAAWRRDLESVARRRDIADLVRSQGSRFSDSARAALERLTPDTGFTVATEVRDATGVVLVSIGQSLGGGRGPDDRVSSARTQEVSDRSATPRLTRVYADSATQSELFARGDSVFAERVVPIHDNGRLVGHVVQVRRIRAASSALRTLSSLIGPSAVLVAGNRDGSLWTDFRKVVRRPPVPDSLVVYERDGRRWVGAVAATATGPYLLSAELPEDVVLAPVRALGSRLVLIGVTIVLLATVLTERLSRQLTRPLTSLTKSAEAIAAGQRGTLVEPLERSDELGRLSAAFAAMAQSIRTSHDTLEHEIDERTQELRAALTQLQEAQAELVRKEKLATLGQVSGSIAHELRNPLGVMANALFYLDAVLGDAPPKVRDHLAKLRAQVRLSESIINGLLGFTRSGPPSPEEVSVAHVVEAQLARITIPDTVKVRCDIPPDVPDVRADPVHVGQILMNLFTNAIQAMGAEQGVLTILARRVGDHVRLEVRDTGPGIPTEDRERVFEPLFTTKARGIGLGLSVSRSLAQANGGTLSVQPGVADGVGATVALELPASSLVRDVTVRRQGSTQLVS